MSQISEGSALVLALACALWIYEVTKVIHAQRNRLIDLPVRARDSSPMAISPNLEPLVSRILRRDGDVAVTDFLGERLAAYESIVAVYGSGDRETLRKLVSRNLRYLFRRDRGTAGENQDDILTDRFAQNSGRSPRRRPHGDFHPVRGRIFRVAVRLFGSIGDSKTGKTPQRRYLDVCPDSVVAQGRMASDRNGGQCPMTRKVRPRHTGLDRDQFLPG
jgi:hypothetical protein